MRNRIVHGVYVVAHRLLRAARACGLRFPGAFVAIWCGDRILLVKTSYQPFFTLPGGITSVGESARRTAAREAREEAGVALAEDALTPVRDSPMQARLARDRVALFAARVDTEPPVTIDGTEIVWAGFVPANDARVAELWPPFRAYVEAGALGR